MNTDPLYRWDKTVRRLHRYFITGEIRVNAFEAGLIASFISNPRLPDAAQRACIMEIVRRANDERAAA